MTTMVDIASLTTRIPTVSAAGHPAWVHAATDVSLRLQAGRVHGLVGESGCGKSMLATTLLGLLPAGTVTTGSVRIGQVDVTEQLTHRNAAVWQQIRGRRIGLAAQSAATFLTPTRTIGNQLVETITELTGDQSPEELMDLVGLDARVLTSFPHELSGGMVQRAAMAFALAGQPEVMIADEPTANLDPKLTGHILSLLRRVADLGAAVLLITHDLASLIDTQVADDLSVMYASRIVEHGPAEHVLASPSDLYTQALIAALPRNGLVAVPGMPPSLMDLDPEVRFADRLTQGGVQR